jgi:hypothetical protein
VTSIVGRASERQSVNDKPTDLIAWGDGVLAELHGTACCA